MNGLLKAEFETITPEKAADLLSRNILNRPLSQVRIRQYMTDMLAGKWEENGEAIKITKDGRLADGQHRLKAVIQCNRSMRMLVVRGLDNDAIPTLDTGKARSAGDVLSLSGIFSSRDAAAVSPAVRLLMRYETGGNWLSAAGGGRQNALSTNQAVFEYSKAHVNELTENLEWLKRNLNTASMLSAGERLFFFTIFNRINPEDAQRFALQIFKGVGLPETGTVYFLREYLLRIKTKAISHPAGHTRHTIVKCWNSLRAGREIKHGNNIQARKEDGMFAK